MALALLTSVQNSGPCAPGAGIVLALVTAILAGASVWAIVKVHRPAGVLWKPMLIAFTAWHLIPWPCSTLGGAYMTLTECRALLSTP